VSVCGNSIETVAATGSTGIYVSSDKAVVSGNVIFAQSGGVGSTGIAASGSGASISDNFLTGWEDGITLSGTDCSVSGNSLTAITADGIHSNDNRNSVTGNTVSAAVGIVLYEKNTASGNIVIATDAAITGDANTVISGNLVESTNGDAISGLNEALNWNSLIQPHDMHRPMKTGKIENQIITFNEMSLGFDLEVKIFGSIKLWNKLFPYNSVKLKQGTFMILETSYKDDELLTLKCIK
jgi:putative cofactor-binding repeat protein